MREFDLPSLTTLTSDQKNELIRLLFEQVRILTARVMELEVWLASRLHWLHTAASETHTWYGVHPKRGMEAIEAHGILPKRIAILVHDCWKLECEYALCNAHLLRELVFLHKSTGQTWPQRMIDLLISARDTCVTARPVATELPPEQTKQIFVRYHAVLDEGKAKNPEAKREGVLRGRVKQTPAINLLRRMSEHATDVLRFVTDLRVPFTNNLGERAIRMPKVKQKISGCFRTIKGAENFCTIRSYLDTMHKQRHNTFELLRNAFMGNLLYLPHAELSRQRQHRATLAAETPRFH